MVDEAGDVIYYSVLVTNTGNQTLTDVTVVDPLLGALSCTPAQPATLASAAPMTCTGSYTVPQSDIDNNGGRRWRHGQHRHGRQRPDHARD